MMWQDIVLTFISFLFAAFLYPALTTDHKPHKLTSITTCVGLLACSVCYATLGLYLATGASLATSVCWAILFIQKERQEKENE